MLCPHLPASNRVKQARKEINELLEYTQLSPPYPGAYRSFKATLVEKISKAVSNFISFSLGFIGGEGCLLGREGSEWTRGQGVGMLQMCKYRIGRQRRHRVTTCSMWRRLQLNVYLHNRWNHNQSSSPTDAQLESNSVEMERDSPNRPILSSSLFPSRS